jgi:hypothetical protein
VNALASRALRRQKPCGGGDCGRNRSLGRESMQLSILIATNRIGLLACSRIAQACSWASPAVEVIVRDNSGDAQKREFLANCKRDYCNIIVAEPCGGLKNVSEIIALAKGEFVFLLADDDFCFDRAIPAICEVIGRFGSDPSIAGITGAYAVETSQASAVLSYQNIESDDVTKRVTGFLSYAGPNIMHYAPIRRDIVQRIFAFMNTLPGYYSYHDQIVCLLYLLNGKFVRLNRLLYLYDLGVWENQETAQKRDLDFYVGAGFDPAMNILHWFICGFEGAILVRNADVFPDLPRAERQAITDLWFSVMFARFKGHVRVKFESRFTGEAEKLREKLLGSTGRILFPDLLKELCDFMALFSADKARAYFEFWDGLMKKSELSPPRPAEVRAAS